MKKIKLYLVLFFVIFSCKKEGKFEIKINPDQPLQGQKVEISFSKNFSGFFWWIELSGGDPYRLIPHIEKIEKSNKIEIIPVDKNTALILFAFEDKEGKFLKDSTYFIVYYTPEKKPAPYALSMLGFFYFSKDSPFENQQKFSSLWLKENKYYPAHYDFWDNFFQFNLTTGSLSGEEIRSQIESKFEKEKNNPSFLHAVYLTYQWVLNDTLKANEILTEFEKMPDDKYKYSAFLTSFRKDIHLLTSYIKEKKFDPFMPEFRNTVFLKFTFPVPDLEGLLKFIEEREKEGFIKAFEISKAVKIAKRLGKNEIYKECMKKLEEVIDDPIKTRKDFAFSYWGRFSLFERYIKNVKNFVNEEFVDYYLAQKDFEKAYSKINEIIGDRDFTEIEPLYLEKYAFISKKLGKIKEAEKAYGYLHFFYGKEEILDSLKAIYGEEFEKRIKELEKEITSKFPIAPEFEVKLLSGESLKASELKGKIIVLNFWATWCGPCRMEIPELNELVSEFKENKDIVFLAITSENKKTVSEFLKKQKFEYRIAVEGLNVQNKFKIFAYPTHFIIDKKGRIVFKQVGYLPGTGKRLERRISSLLKIL